MLFEVLLWLFGLEGRFVGALAGLGPFKLWATAVELILF